MKRLLPAGIAFGLGFLGLGCGPDMPAESEARAWLEADASGVAAFDERTRRYIAEEELLLRIAGDDPMHLELAAGRERARAVFRESALPEFAGRIDVLGAQVRLIDGDRDTGVLGGTGTPQPTQNDSNTRAEDGVEVDGKKLGWGVYGVDAEDGSVTKARGYELYWETALEGRVVSFRLFMPGT